MRCKTWGEPVTRNYADAGGVDTRGDNEDELRVANYRESQQLLLFHRALRIKSEDLRESNRWCERTNAMAKRSVTAHQLYY
jgi:hypothetical protein